MNITTITNTELVALYEKISLSDKLMVVAVNKGRLLNHKAETDIIQKMLKANPEIVVGFYDYQVKIDWLKDDLEYMGVVVE